MNAPLVEQHVLEYPGGGVAIQTGDVGSALIYGFGKSSLGDLGERRDARHVEVRVVVERVDEHGGDAGGTRAVHVSGRRVAHVDRALGRDAAEAFERECEHTWAGLGEADDARVQDRADLDPRTGADLADAVLAQLLLQAAVRVRDHRDPHAGRRDLGQRLPRAGDHPVHTPPVVNSPRSTSATSSTRPPAPNARAYPRL